MTVYNNAINSFALTSFLCTVSVYLGITLLGKSIEGVPKVARGGSAQMFAYLSSFGLRGLGRTPNFASEVLRQAPGAGFRRRNLASGAPPQPKGETNRRKFARTRPWPRPIEHGLTWPLGDANVHSYVGGLGSTIAGVLSRRRRAPGGQEPL